MQWGYSDSVARCICSKNVGKVERKLQELSECNNVGKFEMKKSKLIVASR